MVLKKATKKVTQDALNSTEKGARKALLEELFYDFNTSRLEIYHINFMRGVFFALGSLVGGSVALVIVVWLLSLLVDLPGGIGSFIQSILDAMQSSRS